MFIDYYEILELSPNANSETIERIFRHFAKRYHPDNRDTGDETRFNDIVEAHNALRDQEKLLSLLYVKRRREVNNHGIGDSEIERLLGCPSEHLEFHLWYMKAKGWI